MVFNHDFNLRKWVTLVDLEWPMSMFFATFILFYFVAKMHEWGFTILRIWMTSFISVYWDL